jgi:hypothetical protein
MEEKLGRSEPLLPALSHTALKRRLPVRRRSRASQTGESDRRLGLVLCQMITSTAQPGKTFAFPFEAGRLGRGEERVNSEQLAVFARSDMEWKWLQLHGQCGTGRTMD